MADPVSMAVIGTAAAAGGSIISGIGASTSADASAAAYNYKAGIATMNAQIAGQNAAWAINSGGVKASEEGLKDAQEIGQTKVNQAASGLDVNAGSAAAVRKTQTDVAQYNQGIIRSDAAHTAYGYETQAAGDTAEATLDRSSASNAETAGQLGVLSSIIGGVSSVAGKWSQANTLGIGSGSSSSNGMDASGNPAWGN